jgi:hypothetical protein
MHAKRRFGWVVGFAMAASVGCAQERDPINRVQANAMSKHFFAGASLSDPSDDPEFYMRNSVIDVPYGAMQDGLFTASYAQPLTRVKWEISETTLIARETYEHVADSDFNGSRTTNNGQVVAMFTIESHFDIKRDYNPQTGEENNLVVENTTDRPWYEREYMRVDWSKNLVTDGYEVDTLSQIGVFGGVKFDPEAYFIDDPSSPDAPVFSEQDGYFDVTTKAFATPQMVQTPYGTFPACFLPADYGGAGPIANCNPTEVTLRLAFRQVKSTDYEPEDQTGPRQQAFGWFTVDRYGYDRNYGVLDEDWHRFAAKYNLWQRSHVQGAQCAVDYWRDANGNVQSYKVDGAGNYVYDGTTGLPVPDPNGKPYAGTPVGASVHRDVNKNGTEDDCEFTDANGSMIYAGSRCDEFSLQCDLPLYMRKTRTIPWYFGPQSDPKLFATTAKALGEWNLAVKRAVVLGKMVEAKRVGVDPTPFTTAKDASGNALDLTTEAGLVADGGKAVPDVFVLCHNPVVTGDDPSCGAPGLLARVGDLRYNMVNIIPTPQTPSPWGIMVDSNDPLTGEKVATSVNEWEAVLDFAAQNTEDLIRWMDGEISDQQIASGAYLRDWVAATKLGGTPHAPATLSKDEIAQRIASVDRTMANAVTLPAAQQQLPRELRLLAASQQLATTLGPSLDSQLEATRQSLIESSWEAQLVTPEWLQAAGMDPTTPVAGNDAALAKASSLRGMNPKLAAWVRHQRDITMAQHGACEVEEPEPDALVGLARYAQTLFPLPDPKDPDYPAKLARRQGSLHDWIREQFHLAVIAHEMGHSMGLRHNFAASFDPLNYHTEYWQLRTRNGQEHYCVTPGANGKQPPWGAASSTLPLDATTPHTDGSECVGPRWVDPVTDQETAGLVWKWGSSSVMDYPGDLSQDMNDIGPYDKAAMRYGYADLVDVDTDAKVPGGAANPTPDPAQSDKGSAYVFALDGFGGIVGAPVGAVHYSTLADKFGVLGTCTTPTDPNDPLTATCSGPPLDYAALRDMVSVGKYGADVARRLPETLASFAVDPKGRARHPYMFGSDEYADFGNVPVFRFDAGGDSYEQFQFLVSTYENRYVFDNFRRDRPTFSTQSVITRTMTRYFDKIQGMTKSLALLTELLGPTPVGGTDPLQDPGYLMPLALGASDGLKMFARVLTRPEPGPFGLSAPPMSPDPSPGGQQFASALGSNFIVLPAASFTVPLGSGAGRYLHNDYDYSQGYYWADYQTQVGSAYEKSIAVWYLTEAYNNFLSNSKEDYVDGRYKNLNYASLYPNQVRRLFAQILQNDPMTYGPYVEMPSGVASDGTGTVRYLPWEKYDPTTPGTTALDYPTDAVVVDPLLGWEQQYRAILYLFYMGRTSLTMDTIDQLRIYSPGDAASVSLPPDQQVAYRDPSTGVEYVARNYGTEQINSRLPAVARSMGARMIQYANQLAAATYVVKSTDPVTGEMTYATDGNGQSLCQSAASCKTNPATLKNFSANLDSVRELARFLGYGPISPVPPAPGH